MNNHSLSPFKPSPFFYLNISQFLSNLNDNLYKYLLIFSVIDVEGAKSAPFVLAASGIIFILPFLFLSFYAGVLADRFSKRNIIVITKIIEVFTVTLLLFSFLYENILMRYIGLFILAFEEAIISPSKYSIIPELVDKDQITEANGYLVSFTYIGMMLGAFLASILTQVTGHNYVLASLACILTALCGLLAALKIPTTAAYAPTAKCSVFFFKDIFYTMKRASNTPYLLPSMMGSALFLFLAAYSQANIISYSISCLHLSDVAGGYYSFITTIGVSIGGIVAGKISGPRVALGLVPLAALGMAICFWMFDCTVGLPNATAINAIITGIFAGLYLVPLDSYVQAMSSNDIRGQNVATSNFFGWLSVLVASFLFYYMSHKLSLSPQVGFELMSVVSVILLVIFALKFTFPMLRLASTVLRSMGMFTIKEMDKVPKNGAAVIVVKRWGEAFYLLSHRRRIVQLAASYHTLSWRKRTRYEHLKIATSEKLSELLDQKKLCCYILGDVDEDQKILQQIKERGVPLFSISLESHILTISNQA
ncbi:MAG: MFS transporter [Verrucomicrobia bacterium]|nr:MFS transporter [Verrucomicrobiota bacterium]